MMERVRDELRRDGLVIAHRVSEPRSWKKLRVELVDDNDDHGLVTSAAGYPCTTALHEANVRPRHAGTPMEPRTALRAGLLQGRSLKDGAQGRSLRC